MKRASTLIWLATAGATVLGQPTKPAIAEEKTPIALIARICMQTFVHGERKELCGYFQLKPDGPSGRFLDLASCEARKDEALTNWRKEAAQAGMIVPGDRIEELRCVSQ